MHHNESRPHVHESPAPALLAADTPPPTRRAGWRAMPASVEIRGWSAAGAQRSDKPHRPSRLG